MNPAGSGHQDFPVHGPGIPRHRMAKRSEHAGEAILDHLPKMAAVPNSANADFD